MGLTTYGTHLTATRNLWARLVAHSLIAFPRLWC